MYGDESKWLMLAELMEHYKLQEVDHFYLYVKDYDNYTYKLIESYARCDRAEIIHFREQRDRPGEEWQRVGIQASILLQYCSSNSTRLGPRFLLSLCLAPMYGDESKWLMLAELMEHYKLQEVDHFYLYVKDYDNYTYKLIESYARCDRAEIIHFREQRDRPGEEWQRVGIQVSILLQYCSSNVSLRCMFEDCLFRSRHHSKYAIFADLDERIIPTTNLTLHEYGEKTLHEHLPALIFTNTTKISPAGTLDKCILDPTQVFIMDVHNIAAFFPGNHSVYQVPPDEAVIRLGPSIIFIEELWHVTVRVTTMSRTFVTIFGLPGCLHLNNQLQNLNRFCKRMGMITVGKNYF
ncbi:hypothetical protein OESDEN_10695 [Oesophagostomum dentatum]|uniref:Glycosyltransferase family 92 protein n=1 Tax=Oesophagostomum dentatum TaxID=61180 RepID=A0A0B1SWX8_OESDE|nr:hypothetical protein OESDEN_10695 [Oesophagostomum dentatum]